jgi:PleD family two-component response regulator
MARISGGGRVFRYGGEEFVVVFKRKGANRSKVYMEDLREIIANYPMMIRSKARPGKAAAGKKLRHSKIIKKRVKVTVSIGLAERNEQLRLPDQVMKAADKALYKAKKAGRNCVCTA